jgi:hypothetical protein
MHTEIVWDSQKEKDHKEEIDVAGKLILKWNLEKWDRMLCTGFFRLRNRSLALANVAMKLRVAYSFGRFF